MTISDDKTRLLGQLKKGNITQESYDNQMDYLEKLESMEVKQAIMRGDRRKNPVKVNYRLLTFAECKALGEHSHILDREGNIAQVKITSIKTWKTRPDEIEVHCKYGLYEFFVIRIDAVYSPNEELVTILPDDDEDSEDWIKPDTSLYEYYIDLDERGEFFADVRNHENKTVFEIHGFQIFQDGFMSDKNDIQGLKSYLVSLGILKDTDKLQSA